MGESLRTLRRHGERWSLSRPFIAAMDPVRAAIPELVIQFRVPAFSQRSSRQMGG